MCLLVHCFRQKSDIKPPETACITKVENSTNFVPSLCPPPFFYSKIIIKINVYRTKIFHKLDDSNSSERSYFILIESGSNIIVLAAKLWLGLIFM